jgi:hypothetical protein
VNLICECNVCGYIGDDRNSHDCSAHMQQRIAALTARAENVSAIALRAIESETRTQKYCVTLGQLLTRVEKEREAEKAAREKAEQEVERLRTVLIAVDEWDLNWADGLDSNVERIKTLVRAALER